MNYRNIAIGLVTSSILGFSLLQNFNSLDTIQSQKDIIAEKEKEITELKILVEEVTYSHEILAKENQNYKEENQNYKIEIENLEKNILENLGNLTIDEMFKVTTAAYGIDFNLVYAIARLETGNFSSDLWLNHNNPGGIKSNNGWASYSSPFEGIVEMCRLLKHNYVDRGLTSPESIGSVYCPNNASEWASQVRILMGE